MNFDYELQLVECGSAVSAVAVVIVAVPVFANCTFGCWAVEALSEAKCPAKRFTYGIG